MPASTSQTFTATLARLARPHDIRALPLAALHLVMAMRLCALFERAGRDPVPDLAQRYHSVEAACAVHGLVLTITRTWPEPFMVNRPCCLAMSPDEATLAAMVRAAAGADRSGFEATLTGFVRADRHAALHEATLHAVATLQASAA